MLFGRVCFAERVLFCPLRDLIVLKLCSASVESRPDMLYRQKALPVRKACNRAERTAPIFFPRCWSARVSSCIWLREGMSLEIRIVEVVEETERLHEVLIVVRTDSR